MTSLTNWSSEEREKLRSSVRGGKSWKATAIYVGRSPEGCKTMWRKMREENLPNLSPDQITTLVGMYRDHDIKVMEIAAEFSITVYEVRAIAFANGCVARGAGSSTAWQKKEAPYRQKITPWPEDMPRFTDHPATVTSKRSGARFINGER